MMNEMMLSTGQAARRLGVSGEWVRKLIRRGVLPAQETPLGYLLPVEAVEHLLAERQDKQKRG